MLTTASQFGPRARSLRTKHATATATAHRVLVASSAATVQQYQQTRDFRFGSWFSHLDSGVHEEIKRRQQVFKLKYADQLSRRLKWDNHPLADNARHAVKRMMAAYWLSHDARPCGRNDDADPSKQRTVDNKDGVCPGQNIEDVERGAMEDVMFGKGGNGPRRGPKSKRKRGGKKDEHDSVPHTSYGIPEHNDYFIDPITNRKVAKHPAPSSPEGGVNIPIKRFEDYQTRCTSRHGVLNDEPSAGGLHGQSEVETETNKEHIGAALDPTGKPKPISHNDSHAESHAPTNEDYKQFQVDTPNARISYKLRSAPMDERLYDPVRHNEHAEARDPIVKYDDLLKYKPVIDDGQVSSERPQQLDTNLGNYKPTTDKKPVQFEDLKPPYEDLHKYNPAVIDKIVARFEHRLPPYLSRTGYTTDFEPEGPSKEDAEPKQNDLDKTKSGYLADATTKWTEDSATHEDLEQHRLFKLTEPRGKPPGHQIHSIKPGFPVDHRPSVEDLEPGNFPPSTVEQLRAKYRTAELRKHTAVRNLEPDGNLLSSAEERVAQQAAMRLDSEELAKYEPVYHNEPGGTPLPAADGRVIEDGTKRYDPEELAKYTPVYWNEPDGQPIAAEDSLVPEGLTKEYDPDELAEYKPVYWNEPDGQPPTSAEELGKKHNDQDQCGPVKYQERDGHRSGQTDAVTKGSEEMDVGRDFESADRLASEEFDKADEPSAEVLRRMGKSQQTDEDDYEETKRRQIMELQMKRYQTASDAVDSEARLAVNSARARAANAESERQLTGNCVRDFPEEFDKSWTETLSKSVPETAHPDDGFVFESQNMDGGLEGAFGQPTPARIQPALDRHLDDQPHMTGTSRATDNKEGGSNAAQVPATMHAGVSGGTPTSPAQVKRHGDVSGLPGNASEPTLYKILAYDQTMQKVETAETSSFVPDNTSALTPVDALLRLSHPTRFFPHFAPLQAEGYEIVSGTGDVLVFRKARPDPSRTKPAEQTPVHGQPSPAADESGAVETRINPIDMTGRPRFSPASANFASPTGYVNYDNIPDTTASKLPPPPPKIKYNIDVHREEPVFSGPKGRRSDSQAGKKMSLGKRLVVGGVWVAGISYALGVIAEFFTTGGMDGRGPTGL